MLRGLAIALSLSTAIVAAGAGQVQAGPAIAGIAAFAATPIGGVVVNAGISLAFAGGAALIDHLTSADQERPAARPVAGYSGTVPNDPTAPIGFVMGTRAVAGTIVYRGVWGSAGKVQNAYYVEERVLSDVPLGDAPGPAKLLVGKKARSIDWNAAPATQGYPIPYFNRDGKDHAWVRFANGTQTTADTYLRAKFGTHPEQPYTAGMIGRGQAKLIVTFRANPKLFKTGFPEWKAITAGIKLYNIAKDSTRGGSGTHRIDNPATWETSDLLPVHIFNGLMGVRYGSEWVWGGQSTSITQLPAANWIAAIAEANTTVDKVGGTEKQYVGGMEIAGDMEPASVFEHQLRGCSGRFAEIGGIYKMICGLPASPVMSLSDSSIIISRDQQYEPFPRPEATFNALLSKYYEPSAGWQLKDVPERRNDTWIAEDGGYRPAHTTYEVVTSGTQAQRLDDEAMRDSRRWRTHSLPLPPSASELEPLDMIALSSVRWGYASKTFLLDGIDDEETFEQFATIREVDATDHGSYDPDVDELDMVFPSLDLAPPAAVQMAGYQVFADTVAGDNGAARPTIRLRIPGGLDDVAFIRAVVRRDSDQSQVWTGTLPYAQGLADGSTYDVKLGAVVLQLTAYEVEATEIPFSSRDVVSSGWLDVTTGAVPLGPADVSGLTLTTFATEVSGALKYFAETTRAIIEQAQELATMSADEALANYDEHTQIRRELQLTKEDVTARYLEAITVAIGPGSAVASRFELLEATVNTTYANALSILDSRVDTVDDTLLGLANAITQVSAGTVAGDVSTVRSRMTAQNGPGGSAEVAWQVFSGTLRAASVLLRAPSNPLLPTEFIVDAQAMKFGDFGSGSEINALVYSAGVWKLNVAHIGTVNAGLISMPGGASFNLGTGVISVPGGASFNLVTGVISMQGGASLNLATGVLASASGVSFWNMTSGAFRTATS